MNEEYTVVEFSELTEQNIQDSMYAMSLSLFSNYYPNTPVAPKSISVGELYESTKSYSCQIRFTLNGTICKCKYYKDTSEYEIEFYELTHVRKSQNIMNLDNKLSLYMDKSDYISQRKTEDMEITVKRIEKTEIKKDS